MRTIAKIFAAVLAVGAVVWSARDRFIQVSTRKEDTEIPRFRTPQTPPQLTDITGIGPAYAQRLIEIGIEDVAALAMADASKVADKIEVDKKRIELWIENAAELR